MYRIKRFSQKESSSTKINKAANWSKKKAKSLYDSSKYAVTHPNETTLKVGNYIKKNPDEAIAVIGSNVVPLAMAGRFAKKGNKKAAAIAATAAALPIGEAYVAGKVALRSLKNKKKDKSSNK